jgi:hypothetical protein
MYLNCKVYQIGSVTQCKEKISTLNDDLFKLKESGHLSDIVELEIETVKKQIKDRIEVIKYWDGMGWVGCSPNSKGVNKP